MPKKGFTLKIFGKELFSYNRGSSIEPLFSEAHREARDSKYLIDFIFRRGFDPEWGDDSIFLERVSSGKRGRGRPKKEENKKPSITPKGVYEAKMLNDAKLVINTTDAYVADQIKTFKEKQNLLRDNYDTDNGRLEIASMLMRLENRKKYKEFESKFAAWPYTTNTKIKEVVNAHDNLEVGVVETFMADMPEEAVKAMKEYKELTKALCGKEPVFYVIADKKDFRKTQSRKDPVLLAQSPFGHFWQILGAWDKEMVLLEEL